MFQAIYGSRKRQIRGLLCGTFLYILIIIYQSRSYEVSAWKLKTEDITITRKQRSEELVVVPESKTEEKKTITWKQKTEELIVVPESKTEEITITRKQKSEELVVVPESKTEELSNKFSGKMPKEDVFVDRPWYMAAGKRRPVPPSDGQKSKLFPEELPGSDRIIEQLMYILPKKEENRSIKTVLLANGFSEWVDVAGGQTEFTRLRCPVDRCKITDSRKASATADAVIFVLHPLAYDPIHYNFNVDRPSKQVWIFYSLENPYLTRFNFNLGSNMFNLTATYRRDSDIVTPYQRWVYYDAPVASSRLTNKNYAAKKTKKVAVLMSNCHSFNARLQFVTKLAQYIQVDIFGACGPNKCFDWDNCMKQIRKYKFYLSFENANCRDYITEKFFVNGLKQDVLPIVMGARPQEYAAVAPNKSYLHVNEFNSIKDLAKYLHVLDKDDDLYNSYFKWKGTGEFINTFFFCRLCAMLHAIDLRNRNAHYLNVESWMNKAACMPVET